jgi:hypothetical protein
MQKLRTLPRPIQERRTSFPASLVCRPLCYRVSVLLLSEDSGMQSVCFQQIS